MGDEVVVECAASGSPTPLTSWYKLKGLRRFISSGNILRIPNIESESDGVYECVADNGIEKALKKTFKISVYGKIFSTP